MIEGAIHWKTRRRINGLIRRETRKLLKKYFCSLSFIYMIGFAFLHYFFDEDSIFLNTFGVVLIEMIASFTYYKLYLLQRKRDAINIVCENKKIQKPYKVPLIDKNIGEEGTIAAFKMVLFLICSFMMTLYYGIGGYIFKKVEFMSLSNAFEFGMFFISVAYFDVFWEGGVKKFYSNFKRMRNITEEDKRYKKIMFYVFLCFVAVYQLYVFISDIIAMKTIL
ncbi:hypothetical protein [Clostridium algidicarnis]|uniref:hypothetical protein n=1 Tax=Clostridium algidicarnis TaxID=37659 RepID=UPI001C0C78D1|nr:hypothetical protein [Clostridium algidicarnis]MBU3227356.1 hypothetical protein [Clostridium algidicarnis]MBU3250879.1 hypothetical protein [Clostridium algidicarnis]